MEEESALAVYSPRGVWYWILDSKSDLEMQEEELVTPRPIVISNEEDEAEFVEPLDMFGDFDDWMYG